MTKYDAYLKVNHLRSILLAQYEQAKNNPNKFVTFDIKTLEHILETLKDAEEKLK